MEYSIYGSDYFNYSGDDKPYRYFNTSVLTYTTVYVREVSFGVGKVPLICYLVVENKKNNRIFKFHLYNNHKECFDIITFDIDLSDGVPVPKLLKEYVQYTSNEHLASLVLSLSGNAGYITPDQKSDISYELRFTDMLSLIDSKTDCVYVFQSNSFYNYKELAGSFNPENFLFDILDEFYSCDLIHHENMQNIMTGDSEDNECVYVIMANELCDLLGDHSDYETYEILFESKFLYLPKLVEKDIVKPKNIY